MSKKTKDEIMVRLRRRYARAGTEHKAKLLDEAVEMLGYHRKAAIRALGRPEVEAIDTMNGKDLGGRALNVSIARPREPRPSGGGGGGRRGYGGGGRDRY